MGRDLIEWMVLASIIVAGLAVCVGTWVPRRKRAADWFMAAGGTMTPLAMIGLTVVNEIFYIFGEWLDTFLYGLLAGGALLFAMGYVMDRLNRRNQQDYRHMAQPRAPHHS